MDIDKAIIKPQKRDERRDFASFDFSELQQSRLLASGEDASGKR
jgi:hypothetical protein